MTFSSKIKQFVSYHKCHSVPILVVGGFFVAMLATVAGFGSSLSKGLKPSVVEKQHFTGTVIGTWYQTGSYGHTYFFTVQFTDDHVVDLPVITGLGFCGKIGDTVFGTIADGKYEVEGIRKRKDIASDVTSEKLLIDAKQALAEAQANLERLKQVEVILNKDKKNIIKLLGQVF